MSILKQIGAVGLLALVCGFGAQDASAITLDFELGLTGSANVEGSGWEDINDLTPNYGGLSWDSGYEVVTSGLFSSVYNNTAAFPSGNEAAYNGDGVLMVSTSGDAFSSFVLQDANFIGWGQNNVTASFTSTSVSVEGFLGGSSVGTWSIANLSTTAWTLLSFGNTTVDTFVITSSGNEKWWLMDDLRIQPVPLPAALPLYGAGLAVMGFLGWRRKRKA